jgi:membrane protease YdiL (CAAX protease family)
MNEPAVSPIASRTHVLIGIALFSGLLVLRFPFLILMSIVLPGQSPIWEAVVFYGGTYILTACLIWHERDRLAAFWIDLAAGITFICQFFFFPIGIGLAAKMRNSGSRFPKPPAGLGYWVLFGPCLAILLALGIQLAGLFPQANRIAPPPDGFQLATTVVAQILMAAVMEEPLFRGFFWGYMRKAGCRNAWIWLFQALLFTAGHVYYLSSEPPGAWFVRMMLPALLFGLMAWGAKSIFASMVTHGTFNAVSDMLAHSGSLQGALMISWQVLVVLLVLLAALTAVKVVQRSGRSPNTT